MFSISFRGRSYRIRTHGNHTIINFKLREKFEPLNPKPKYTAKNIRVSNGLNNASHLVISVKKRRDKI